MDNIPPPLVPPISPMQPPAGGRNWWQRNWLWFVPVGCVTLLGLFVAFVGVIVLVVFGAMKSSDVYKTAVGRAKTNEQVIDALGSPISEGMFLSGTTNVNGNSGNADFAIPISGPKGKGTIYAVATKSEGAWAYSKLDVKVERTGETIDLGQ